MRNLLPAAGFALAGVGLALVAAVLVCHAVNTAAEDMP